jgi:two-component system chemotaxis sensor kinase CheA
VTNEEIQGIFFLECEEALTAAEAGLAACREGRHDDDTVNGVFRAVHSIKGGAGAFCFTALQAFTHGFETTLSDVRDGILPIEDSLVDLLLRALDMLNDHFLAVRDGAPLPDDAALLAELAAVLVQAPDVAEETPAAPAAEPVVAEPVMAETPAAGDDLDFDLDSMLAGMALDDVDLEAAAAAPEAAQETVPGWTLLIRPLDAAMANGGEPILLLRELERLGGQCIHCDVQAVPHVDEIDTTESSLAWTFLFPEALDRKKVEEVFDFVGDDFQLSWDVPVPAGFSAEAASTIDVAETIETPAPAPLAEAAPVVAIAPVAEPVAEEKPTAAAPAPAPAPEPVVTPVPAAPAEPVAAQPAPAPVASAPAPAAAAEPATGDKGAAPAAATGASQSIRIDLFKLDRLIDTVGELVIAQAMMAQRLAWAGTAAVEELATLESLTRDIQESAMAIRAQPIGSVFSRVPRMLRELQTSTGKRVRLEMQGEATELDKTVIERLGEPLTHLIRNAVDHGLETPEERVAAGKPGEGVLTLSAEQRSGRILIKVSDDGKGIDRKRVLAKAVERGLVSPEAQMSDEDIDNLIFAPGFSTAATISNISGRGVGMDVVRQNVKDLGGRISIESHPGKGSCFTLALPLTLAISDGMIVSVGDQTLVVPLAHVVESLRPRPEEVASMGASRQMLNVRGKFIPILPLLENVGAIGAQTDPTEAVLVIVDTESAGQAALLVDNIRDQRQFVIKSLDTHYRPVNGVAGATILGDGRVALILDVDSLVADAVATRRLAA